MTLRKRKLNLDDARQLVVVFLLVTACVWLAVDWQLNGLGQSFPGYLERELTWQAALWNTWTP